MCITFTFNIHSSEQGPLMARTVQDKLSKNEEKNEEKCKELLIMLLISHSPLSNKKNMNLQNVCTGSDFFIKKE